MSTIATTPPTAPAATPGAVPAPAPVLAPAAASNPVSFYRMSVDEYARIGEFLKDPRVELLDGRLVSKMPKNPEHSYTTKRAYKTLDARLPKGWTANQEQPVRISEFDEPEPDVSIVRGDDEYKHRKPSAADVGLLAEVSDSSLAVDRGPKLLAYARAGIPVYWIINLVERQIEVYSGPGPSGYQWRRDYRSGEFVPIVIGGVEFAPIAVDDVLP